MNQGFINRIKAQIERIKQYLKENQHQLSPEEIDEALDKISELTSLLESFE